MQFMKNSKILRFVALAALTTMLSSCWPVLVGAGAAGGYIARDKGYKIQSPVEQEGGGGDYHDGY